MPQSRALETVVGLFVAAGLGALLILAMQVSNLAALADGRGYELQARFENVGGLKVRSPVKMGGVRIGRVAAIDYDQERYEAVVTLRIDRRYDRIPVDTTAAIFTSGLLGEQYVALEPGGEEEYLADGDRIELTQSALVLEQVLGRFLFSKAAGDEGP